MTEKRSSAQPYHRFYDLIQLQVYVNKLQSLSGIHSFVLNNFAGRQKNSNGPHAANGPATLICLY